jgi:hypothetical protein
MRNENFVDATLAVGYNSSLLAKAGELRDAVLLHNFP